jgi:hypothetical protein
MLGAFGLQGMELFFMANLCCYGTGKDFFEKSFL